MSTQLYPLKFDPIYQYRLWGGRKLAHLLSKPLPENEPIGEAWILSDRKDHANEVSEGPLEGTTITKLMKDFKYEIMGIMGDRFDQFPLLLKFLDCKEVLSVQVHPSDDQKQYIPKGDSGKTEAWVVLETSNDSRIYAGLKKGTTKENLVNAIQNNKVSDCLHSFVPKKDDALFIHSGTVHTLGGTVVFEVQENSDVTFRLYDWDRTDPKTGEPRELQVEEATNCIDYDQVNIEPVTPEKSPDFNDSEKLFDDDHFKLWRIKTQSEMTVGLKDEPAILVCTDGKGSVKYRGKDYSIDQGEVMLLPAIIGPLILHPKKEITLLQIAIPNKKLNYHL